MTTFLSLASVALLVSFGVAAFRLCQGPAAGDRLVVVQLFGTTAVALLALLSAAAGVAGGLDTALVLSLLGAVTALALVRSGIVVGED